MTFAAHVGLARPTNFVEASDLVAKRFHQNREQALMVVPLLQVCHSLDLSPEIANALEGSRVT